MQYKNLGRSGLKVSEACLGTNMFGAVADMSMARAMVDRAVEQGVNFFDTADVYGKAVSEEYLGRAIHGRRASLVIATKVRSKMGPGPNDDGLSRKHLMDAVEASLRRLQTDYVDLYQMHWFDEHTPLEETLRTLDDLVTQGKVRYVGISNYEAWRIVEALWVSDVRGYVRFECLQQHYSLVNRQPESDIFPACMDRGLGVIAYSPTGAGFLTGKYRRGEPPPPNSRAARSPEYARRHFTDKNWAVLERLEFMAKEKGCAPHHLALKWVATHPAVTAPILGASNADQVLNNLKYLDVSLSAAERQQLSA